MSPFRTLGFALPFTLIAAAVPADPPTASKAVTIKMIDESATAFRFEPAQVTVAPGDTLRFVQTAPTPHNVDLRDTPTGAAVADVQMGPFLTATGATYDLILDDRFPAGTYHYVCTPHEMLGMKATFTVAGK